MATERDEAVDFALIEGESVSRTAVSERTNDYHPDPYAIQRRDREELICHR